MKKIITSLFFFSFSLYSITAIAQPAKVDFIVNLLRASNKKSGVDTAKFLSAVRMISTVILSDTAIQHIEQAANQFKIGKNEDTTLFVLLTIANSNIPDINKKINYNLLLINQIEKSETPHKKLLINSVLNRLRVSYRNSNRINEGLIYYNKWLLQFKQQNDSAGIVNCNYVLGGFYRTIGLNEKAIYHFKKSLAYLDSSKYSVPQLFSLAEYKGRDPWMNNIGVLGDTYTYTSDLDNALKFTRLAFELRTKDFEKAKGIGFANPNYTAKNLSYAFYLLNHFDSAKYYLNKAYDYSIRRDLGTLPIIFQRQSLLALKEKNYFKADSLLIKAWEILRARNIPTNSAFGTNDPDYYRALVQIEQKKYAEAAAFLINDIETVKNLRNETIRDYKLLAEVYDKMGEAQQSTKTYQKYIQLQDSLLAEQRQFASISFEAEQQMSENELSINQLKSENKISSLTRNFSFGIIILVLLLAGVLNYRYRSKQKDNLVLQEQKQKVETTLQELKSTQSPLIQSEKMASLGELTAGIAHEIQNPLNFVNNFSEVNIELIDELKTEVRSLSRNSGIEMTEQMINDIKDNSEKINHHGKRAADIVKGMLQHSRSSSGVKEPTDINALCDEYLRLSYHGLRAKDKSFNATLKTDFDTTLEKINIIPQDIGRVVMNLLTNAFYAVGEKSRIFSAAADESGNQKDIYEPTVSISTKKINNKVEISVSDNGNGIPSSVKEKIFQPFFTTKPTGQGTGLGLSLSYDIVKAHGGELKVETNENVGTTFIISLTA